jgi:hypothetical protein
MERVREARRHHADDDPRRRADTNAVTPHVSAMIVIIPRASSE